MTDTTTLGSRYWCQRCGVAYATGIRPQCECAGDAPVSYSRLPGYGGEPLPNFHPEMAAYRRRVADLRHDSHHPERSRR